MESTAALYHARLLNEVLFALADLAVPALLVATGAAAFVDAIGREVLGLRRPAARTAFTWLAYAAATIALGLPLRWLRLHALERDYGVSWQDTSSWLRLELLDSTTWAVFNGIAMVVAMHAARSGRRAWWAGAIAAYATCAWIQWAVVPPMVEPWTRTQAPLTDSALASRIEGLAARAGMRPPDVLVVATSQHNTGANAYAAGSFGRPRLLLDDNLLLQLDADEMVQVAAHELGHHALHHAWLAWVLDVVIVTTGVAVFAAAWPALRRRFSDRWRIASPTSPAAVPLVMLFVVATEIAAQPLTLAAQRHWERQADAYAIRLSPNPAACTSLVTKLAQGEAPLHWADAYLLGTHPSTAERLAACQPPGRPG